MSRHPHTERPTPFRPTRQLRGALALLALAAWATPGCFEGRSELADAGRPDTGTDGDPNLAARIDCAGTACVATISDARWGAEPCCLEDADAPCGLEAKAPLATIAGNIVPVRDILERAAEDGQPIADTNPTVECMPRNQAGRPDGSCPGASLAIFLGPDAGTGDPDLDAGTEVPNYEVPGCCRPDGFCGYLDPTTDFGCVRITQSLLGKALGYEDARCD